MFFKFSGNLINIFNCSKLNINHFLRLQLSLNFLVLHLLKYWLVFLLIYLQLCDFFTKIRTTWKQLFLCYIAFTFWCQSNSFWRSKSCKIFLTFSLEKGFCVSTLLIAFTVINIDKCIQDIVTLLNMGVFFTKFISIFFIFLKCFQSLFAQFYSFIMTVHVFIMNKPYHNNFYQLCISILFCRRKLHYNTRLVTTQRNYKLSFL